MRKLVIVQQPTAATDESKGSGLVEEGRHVKPAGPFVIQNKLGMCKQDWKSSWLLPPFPSFADRAREAFREEGSLMFSL